MAGKRSMILALITARGGSKGLPRKNILLMHGVPLIGWSIKAADECMNISDCYVSSEDPEILDVSKSLGAIPIERPAELALDESSSEDVIMHFIDQLHHKGIYPEEIVLLQPTSPLRNGRHIDEALDIYKLNNADCVISVFEPKHSPVKAYKLGDGGRLEGLYSAQAPYQARQSLPRAFQPNGAIYIISVKAFLKEGGIPKSNVYPYLMGELDSVDIDDQEDFEYAEWIMRRKNETCI